MPFAATRPASAALLVLATACVPELTSPNPPAEGWTCPENTWECGVPSRSVAESSAADRGFQVGQILPAGLMVDQFGDPVDAWQFYGKVVVIDISTMWCAPCRELACYTEDTWLTYRDDGAMYLTVLPQDPHGEPPEVDDLNDWVSQYGITSPVLSDPDTTWTRDASPLGQYPVVLVTDTALTVRHRIPISSDIDAADHAIRAAVERELGLTPKSHTPVSACQ